MIGRKNKDMEAVHVPVVDPGWGVTDTRPVRDDAAIEGDARYEATEAWQRALLEEIGALVTSLASTNEELARIRKGLDRLGDWTERVDRVRADFAHVNAIQTWPGG